MNITAILLLVGCLQVSARVSSQIITLNVKNAPLNKVFQEIKKQTGYTFIYTETMLKKSKKVSMNVKNSPLQEVLSICFKTQPFTYRIINQTVVVQPKEKVKVNTSSIVSLPSPPPIEIHGRVVNNEGNPLPGVSVLVSGTKNGTTTNSDGRFTLTVSNNGNIVLEISSVGYQNKTVNLGIQTEINITLQEDVTGLSDVVVVGYGTQKRKDLTGSIVSIKPAAIQQTPISSIDQGLAGRASGVMVTQTSGMPGAVASIRIRGTSSLQGGDEPLYVIDGVPVYSGGGFGETGGNASMSALSTLNSNDIESIEILKDASATAIYGSRAANGVILITTKSGKRGRDIISFDSYYGVQSVVKKIDLMDATNYAKLVNEAYSNDGLPEPYTADFISEISNGGKGTNWQDEIYRSTPMQNYQLSFSGGDEKSLYAASLSYLDQKGIVINSNLKRYSGRINFNRKMGERFRINSHLSFSRNISNIVQTDAGGQNGVINGALLFNPILPVYIDKSEDAYTPVNIPGNIFPNPVATAMEMKRKNNTTRLLGDFSGELEIAKGLKAKILFGIDYFMNNAGQYTPSNIYESGGIASASVSDDMYTNWINENTLTYSTTINNKHKITFLAGATFQENREQRLSASSQGFVNDVLTYNNLGSGSVYTMPGSSATKWSIMSYLSRLNYNFKEKYLVTLSGRFDGSSRFGENHKFAFFPATAFAWRASEENFIQNLNLFSNLKVRVGYGVTGNQEIGLYNSLPTLASNNYTFGQTLVTGFSPDIIPNPNLKWERTGQYNAGIDIGIFKNKIGFTVDYYYKKTTDLIYDVSIPFVSGFATSLQNIGSIENKGLELAIETKNIDKEFKWNTSFNISINKSKVLYLGGEQYKDVGRGDGHLQTGSVHRLIVGKPIGVFYGYVFDGIFQNPQELDAGPKSFTNYVGGKRYRDINGPDGVPDGLIDATYDRQIIGNPNPKFFGGLTNTFSYQGFGLNVFLLYSYGNNILNYNAIELGLASGASNVYASLINRWTPENPSNIYAKATTNRSAVFSSQFVEDGSYLKIKTITLSYQFSKLKLGRGTGLKVYATGQNLLTFTNYTGYDPEVSYRGASNLEIGEDFGGYPQSRTLLFGLSLSF